MSKRSQACDISKEVKEKVHRRDNGKCIICGSAGIPNAHFVRRSQGGLGIEKNVVTLCYSCHNLYDNGSKREEFGIKIEKYLKKKYKEWKKEELIYKKY